MKKTLALLLVFVMLIAFISCGSTEKDQSTSSSDTTVESDTSDESPEEEEILYTIGDTVKTNVAEVSVKNVSISDGYGDTKADSDYKFVVITFSFKNIGKKTIGWLSLSGIHPSTSATTYLREAPYVDYNDGYCFFLDDVVINGRSIDEGCFGSNKRIDEVGPLSEAVECTTAIYVPKEVADNTSAPLLIKIVVPTEDYREIFAYKVR